MKKYYVFMKCLICKAGLPGGKIGSKSEIKIIASEKLKLVQRNLGALEADGKIKGFDSITAAENFVKKEFEVPDEVVQDMSSEAKSITTSIEVLVAEQNALESSIKAIKEEKDTLSADVEALKEEKDSLSADVNELKKDSEPSSTNDEGEKKKKQSKNKSESAKSGAGFK